MVKRKVKMPEAVAEYLKKMGSIGGKTAALNMTDEERKARSVKAGNAGAVKRWSARTAIKVELVSMAQRTGHRFTKEQLRDAIYLEMHGKRFCVHYGVDNVREVAAAARKGKT